MVVDAVIRRPHEHLSLIRDVLLLQRLWCLCCGSAQGWWWRAS